MLNILDQPTVTKILADLDQFGSLLTDDVVQLIQNIGKTLSNISAVRLDYYCVVK